MLRVGTVHMSSTKIHNFLNTYPEARKCLTKMRRENDQNSGRMTEDGDSLAVYTRVVN